MLQCQSKSNEAELELGRAKSPRTKERKQRNSMQSRKIIKCTNRTNGFLVLVIRNQREKNQYATLSSLFGPVWNHSIGVQMWRGKQHTFQEAAENYSQGP